MVTSWILGTVAMLFGMQVVPRSISPSGTFIREDLVMKIFLWPFFLFRCFKKSSCQLMPKECTLSAGTLPLGCLLRSSVVTITVRPDMTSAVNHECKATNKQNKKAFLDKCNYCISILSHLSHTWNYFSRDN